MSNLVSVIMPTYNRASYLKDAVESVLCQTFGDLELIIIDDGSTDNTEEIIKTYLKDVRVRYIKQKNSGAAAARNRGIAESTGRIIGFIDSDDIWMKDKLLIQMSVLQAFEEVGVVCSDFSAKLQNRIIEQSHIRKYFSVFDDYGLSYDSVFEHKDVLHLHGFGEVAVYRGRIYETMIFGNCILTSTALCRREVFDTAGIFDTSFETLEDYDLFLRITKIFPAALVDRPLISYNYGNDQLSGERMFGKLCNNLIEIYRRNLDGMPDRTFFLRHRRRIRQHWGRIHSMKAYSHFSKDEMPEAARFYGRSIASNPFNLSVYTYLVGSLLPKGIVHSIRNVKASIRQIRRRKCSE
ncbi:MAG: glycosyltransferase [Nitrospirota bacterium]